MSGGPEKPPVWPYHCVTRQEFEQIKGRVEALIVRQGSRVAPVPLPYEQKSTSYCGCWSVEWVSQRPVYEYCGRYYRVDEVCFPQKPFLVIECGSYEDLLQNGMEDADPFPYDLPQSELENEVKYALGILPYPGRA